MTQKMSIIRSDKVTHIVFVYTQISLSVSCIEIAICQYYEVDLCTKSTGEFGFGPSDAQYQGKWIFRTENCSTNCSQLFIRKTSDKFADWCQSLVNLKISGW